MTQVTTETEKRVIEILTQYPISPDAYTEPIYAVDRAMGWATADTRKFVSDLVDRDLIRATPIARDGAIYNPRWNWISGKSKD